MIRKSVLVLAAASVIALTASASAQNAEISAEIARVNKWRDSVCGKSESLKKVCEGDFQIATIMIAALPMAAMRIGMEQGQGKKTKAEGDVELAATIKRSSDKLADLEKNWGKDPNNK